MTGKTHMMVGTAVGIGVATYFNFPPESSLVLVGCSIFGSLLPDIDHPHGKLNQSILPVKSKLFKALVYLLIGAGFIYLDFKMDYVFLRILGIALIITGFSQHRTFTHSVLGLIFFSSVVYLISKEFGIMSAYIGFVAGYVSHMVADFMTRSGIPIFYPYDKNFTFPLSITTGGVYEQLVLLGAGCFSGYVIFKSLINI